MSPRFSVLLLGILQMFSSIQSAPSNLHTVLSPLTFTPSVDVFRSPVTKVETIDITPTYTKTVVPSASAVAVAGSFPVVQKVNSYSTGDSSNAEIRDLLRSLLSELRNSRSSSITAPAPQILDSYSAPPRNTFTNPNSASYPDSFDNNRKSKPEKVVLVQEKQADPIVRTVYQPIYVPFQYAQQYVQPVRQSLPVAVPTSVRVPTGASAVAISTIHSSPAYAIQQQQVSLPLLQTQAVQPVAYASAGETATILDTSGGGYEKK